MNRIQFGMGVVAVVRDKNTGEVLSTRVMHKRGSDPPLRDRSARYATGNSG